MREADYGDTLSDEQINHFLENQSVGTLAIETNGESSPYNIPISYAYNVVHRPVFQFINHPDSEKMDYAENGTRATLTVIDHRTGGWVSVMLRGELNKVDENNLSWAESTFENNTPDETVKLFVERGDYETEYWTLDTEQMTGRWSGQHSYNVTK